MTQAVDQYQHVVFRGVKSSTLAREPGPIRQAPSPSIFAQPFRPHAPMISPADRLLLNQISHGTKLNLSAYRSTALGRRIPACLRALQVRSPAEAVRRLERDATATELTLNTLLIGVTAFFRDLPVFEHLRGIGLPQLLRTSPVPRVLSVGCSDGAEAYSLAICLLEEGVSGIEVKGIDCRRDAIARAKRGIYPRSYLANVPGELQEKYFELSAKTAQVKAHVRERMRFQTADAFLHVLQPPYDLISCRNFAIYLEHAAAARLWRRLHRALAPGGMLLAGKAERPTSGFLRTGPCLYRKASP